MDLPECADAFRAQRLLDSVADFAIVTLDTDGRVASWNPGAERMLGWAPAEIRGRNVACLYRPEDAACDQAAQDLRATLRGGSLGVDGWRVRRDGSSFWASITLTLLRGAAAEPCGYGLFVWDLSKFRRGEQALQRMSRRIDLALAAGQLGLWEWDAVVDVLDFDDRMRELFGMRPSEAGPGACPQPLRADLRRAHDTLAPLDIEYTIEPCDVTAPPRTIRLRGAWAAGDGDSGMPTQMIGVGWDITQLRQAEQVLRLNQKLSDLVFENASVGLLVTVAGRMVLASQAVMDMLGYQRADLIGKPARMLYPSDEAYAEVGPKVAAAYERVGRFDGELQFVRRDGRLTWVRLMGRPVQAGVPSAGSIWVIDNIETLRSEREQLQWASTHDALTSLTNRAAFEAALRERLQRRLLEPAPRSFCVLAMDLDRFKAVNDSGGHAAGDEMLRALAGVMTHRLRRTDTLARLGGDEFAALLEDCALDQTLAVAEAIRTGVQAYRLHWQGVEHSVGISIGVVEVGPEANDPSSVMAAADAACYRAKREGRNTIRCVPMASTADGSSCATRAEPSREGC